MIIHARWIPKYRRGHKRFVCSNCKVAYHPRYNWYEPPLDCPYCGAKMDKENAHDNQATR